MTAGRSSIARRNVEFYGHALSGHTDMDSRNGTAQGIGSARVSARGLRQVRDQRSDRRAVFSESRVEARRNRAAEVHEYRGPGGRGGDGARRRGRRAVGSGAHGIVAGDFAVQPGAAAGAAQERIFDARFTHERTQEVRTEGRAQALPVHEALIFAAPRPVGGCTELQWVDASWFTEITAGKEPARGCSSARILPLEGRTKVRPYIRQEKRGRKPLSY